MKPFAILEFSRKNRAFILNKLISSIVNEDLTFIIIKTKVSLFELLKRSNIKLFTSMHYLLYSIDSLEKIGEGIKYLLSIKLWHKPIFHILIGNKNFPQIIKNHLRENENVNVNKLEMDLRENILAFIDPLDDDFILYGNNKVKDIIRKNFPESLC